MIKKTCVFNTFYEFQKFQKNGANSKKAGPKPMDFGDSFKKAGITLC